MHGFVGGRYASKSTGCDAIRACLCACGICVVRHSSIGHSHMLRLSVVMIAARVTPSYSVRARTPAATYSLRAAAVTADLCM